MAELKEGRHPGEALLSEANFHRSRGVATIPSGTGIVEAGTVLGKVTASGNFVPSPATGADGSETAVAVALYGADATTSDVSIAILERDAEVNGAALVFENTVDTDPEKDAKADQLRAVGIIVR